MKNKIILSTTLLIFASSAMAADVVVKKQGKSAGQGTVMKESKVPQFPLVQNGQRVSKIPKLDIGAEPEIKAGDIKTVKLPDTKTLVIPKIAERQSPQEIFIDKLVLTPVTPAADAKVLIQTAEQKAFVPDVPQLNPIGNPVVMDPTPSVQKLEELSPQDMKKLQALIFLESQKNYPMALALFSELLDEAPEADKTELHYQIALTAKGLRLYSDYKHYMGLVLKDSDKTWQKKAAFSLYKNAESGDKALVAYLDPILENLKISVENADQYQLNRSKYYLDKNDLTKAFEGVEEILLDSPLYIDALYLKSLILYKGGQLQEAIGIQQAVITELDANKKNEELKSVAALTLARLHFQAGQYKEAFDMYLKVDKKHPEWIQAMIERAWAQILAEDYEGAAGNMFSLHTDFFKKTFSPESYVVRTVGYLNLCQYGDGAKTVHDMKKRYTPVAKQLVEYRRGIKNNTSYYDTVKTWAKNPDIQLVDGLPREFIATMTKHPSFINEQEMINAIEDQVSRYNRISLDLIKQESKALKVQNEARAQLIDIKKKFEGASESKMASLKEDYAFQEKRMMAFKIQHYIAKKARNGIKVLRTAGLDRLEKEKTVYRDRAAVAIKTRFEQMLMTLSNTLDQSDVLSYELYSGAGEHLRYQMAGGDINTKDREQLKVDKKEAVNWEFKGEIWEDEIGHFRSGLKNVCPKDEQLSQFDAR